MWRAFNHIRRVLRGLASQDRGQATSEYAILTGFMVLLLFASFNALYNPETGAVLSYYYDIASLICLPVP
ncbi:MAG TPA: hypothetical protein P5137_08340 [Candidatus Brocadiia bacterium]|nr:hypothetical protein [Candidatus Brocadiia bacterium]